MKYSRLLFVGGGMLASVFAAFSAKKSDKPNIVFILSYYLLIVNMEYL